MNKAIQYLRSSLFSIGMITSTLIFAFPSVLTFPLPYRYRYRFITTWSRFNIWWLKVCCDLDYEVEGREHIPDGPAIIICKHQSMWETLALQLIFPPQVWILKRELLWVPFFGWGLAVLEPIAINRSAGSSALSKLVSQGIERLQSGRWVVVFPEGTRVPPGKTKRFARGGSVLAEKSGYTVVPVAHNAGEYWARRSFLKRPGKIRLVVGQPFNPAGMTAEEINAQAAAWINAKVEEISTLEGPHEALTQADTPVENKTVEKAK